MHDNAVNFLHIAGISEGNFPQLILSFEISWIEIIFLQKIIKV